MSPLVVVAIELIMFPPNLVIVSYIKDILMDVSR